ncbi:helix-turn-helix domain-containing protein [Pseudonocardia sp. H11422]|uniref:helix-turn-helix domain-containing protein n=1 Tax=Pseudonocardia sp. H11422 TaxID=2835866 RepID=UPI001BDC8804|nr:helix-turn-helix transcriptional regulator [Pseudonocardia sp. H11422]
METAHEPAVRVAAATSLGMTPDRVGPLLSKLRRARGLSLADLANATGGGRGWISNVERGRRWPTDRRWVLLADDALHAGGELVATWDRAKAERDAAETARRHLAASAQQARELLGMPDAHDLDELHAQTAQLAVDYLSTPPAPMLADALRIQREAVRRLREHAHRGEELADLHLIAGRTAGVLAYAALDLGQDDVAALHARTAFTLGERAGDNSLQAWARGTQSLVARFGERYAEAADYITDGLQYATVGTSAIRLLCGGAQCAANRGDVTTALALLDKAAAAREVADPDPVDGLLGFSPAKQHYYGASSLMWLSDRSALNRACRDADTAITTWEHEPVEQRSLDDEALAHVYLATARLRLGEIDAAMAAVRPVLELPEDRLISWIRRRVGGLAALLDTPQFARSRAAEDARDELVAFGAGG